MPQSHHFPPEHSLRQLRVQPNKYVQQILDELLTINPDAVEAVMRELRREVYMLGLSGGYKGLLKAAHRYAEREQKNVDGMADPPHQENEEQYGKRLRTWRSYFAAQALSVLGDTQQNQILGTIRARLRENASPEAALSCFSETGQLTKPITTSTPLDTLIDLVALTEWENADQIPKSVTPQTIKNVRRAALEFLTRRLISEDPRLIDVGGKYLKLKHFQEILRSVPGALGEGRIGGKAAGMLVAYAILESSQSEFDRRFAEQHRMSPERLSGIVDLQKTLQPNTSHFIGSAVFDVFIRENPGTSAGTVFKFNFDGNRPPEENRTEYEEIKDAVMQGSFPEYIERQLKDLFKKLHGTPCIIRSSSELEDRFGAAFAGKYKSVYLANSGKFKSDFEKFLTAMKEVYASSFNPDVMTYRKKKGLISYDEEMGLLVQTLNGNQHGDYYYPPLAGVAMSHATQSWGLNPDRGAMTLVYGFGETAVDKGGKVVMFEKPGADPNRGQRNPPRQQEIVVIDTSRNEKRSVTVRELSDADALDKPLASRVFSIEQADGQTIPLVTSMVSDKDDIIITFAKLLESNLSEFALAVEYIVQKLKYVLGHDVDVEFTASYDPKQSKFLIHVVQCRPQNIPESFKPARMPGSVSEDRILLRTNSSLSCGHKENIQYIVYIDPDCYKGNPEVEGKLNCDEVSDIKTWIRQLNRKLGKGNYLIVAPGRWGCNSPEQGVPVTFADFSNAAGFVEIVGREYGATEASFGTHFYQDVVECGMCNLPISTSRKGDALNTDFFDYTPSETAQLVEGIPPNIARFLRVIDVAKAGARHGETDCCVHVAQDNRGAKRTGVVYIARKDQELPIVEN